MREKLAEIADRSIDAIVTDPPYHLTTGKKGGSGMASLNENSPAGRSRIGTGFMGMRWDGGDIAMRPETWALLLRVAKPGAHLLTFSGSRTFHRVWCAVEDAGWEIRDTLMWLHGEGFPKSSNQDGEWQGWGTGLKPAFEPILMARKPLVGTIAENLASYGVGALNIDVSRIPGDKGSGVWGSSNDTVDHNRMFNASPEMKSYRSEAHKLGRWPANILHDGSDEVVAVFPCRGRSRCTGQEQRHVGHFHADTGSAARFFWCSKASKQDRNEGLEGMPRKAVNWSSGDQSPGTFQSPNTDRENENFHPTVKPTELMAYLCRLVTPPGGLILDPFMGSGSTGKAAFGADYSFIGIEIDEQYIEIARRRICSIAPLFAEIL